MKDRGSNRAPCFTIIEILGGNMQVPYSYYEDEVRDGFYVSGMMKRAWAASIEVLEAVARICDCLLYTSDAADE